MTGAWRALRLNSVHKIVSRFLAPLALLVITAFALGCSTTRATQGNCITTGNLALYCGVPHPEDLEPLPGGAAVLASDMSVAMGPSGLVGVPGSLKSVDLRTGAVTVLYPSASSSPGRPDWGDPACPGEIGAALLPHGFYLSQRRDGAWQVLVVNHGGRESVEFFELTGEGRRWSLSWRGCVVPPSPSRLNDVVALPQGGLLVTNMGQAGASQSEQARQSGVRSEDASFLWRWRPGEGFVVQPGSVAPRLNGVQIDAAGHYAYINTADGGGEVQKLDLTDGEIVGAVSVPNPDNASWTTDGRLLVTGAAPGAQTMACFANANLPCASAFGVWTVAPATMRAERIFAHEGPPLGAGTVAIQSGRDLLIGSFAGDRIMVVRDVFSRDASRSAR